MHEHLSRFKNGLRVLLIGSVALSACNVAKQQSAEATGKARMATAYSSDTTQGPTMEAVMQETQEAQHAATAAAINGTLTADAQDRATVEAIIAPPSDTSMTPCPLFDDETWSNSLAPGERFELDDATFWADENGTLTTNVPRMGPFDLPENEPVQLGKLAGLCFKWDGDTLRVSINPTIATQGTLP